MAAPLPPLAKGEELVPNLNTYVRSKLSRTEVLNFADCARALASAPNSEDGGKDVVTKVLPRMSLFGALPPSILPILIAIRDLLDVPKAPNRKTLRLVHYLIQLAAGDGSGGTVVPFSPLAGQLVPVRATDQFEYEAFEPLWTDARAEQAYHYQRAAAFRALAALARSSITTDANDLSLISTLLGAAATSLDRAEQARRRKLPPFGVDKKTREAYQRQALEVVATQRLALSAARVGLPRQVLASKIAPRAFSGVRSPDPVCARHALACAALAAKDAPQLYMEQLAGLVAANVELFKTTGSLAGVDTAAAATPAPGTVPARPTSKDPFQESCLNLSDAWARVYLARGCGAVVHSSYVRGAVDGAAAPFWEALTIMACCDRSNIVALEAIRALSGRPFPRCTHIKPSGNKKVPALDERREQEESAAGALAWQLLVEHADDEAPGPVPQLQAPQQAGQGFTISRTRRVMQESTSLRRLASLGNSVLASATTATAGAPGPAAAAAAAAGPSSDGGSATGAPPTLGLFAALGQRLLNALLQMSHASVCSATRTVATLAEARARALVAVRADRPNAAGQRELLMGDASLQKTMGLLEQRMRAIAEDVEFGAHQRELALEALLWLQLLPAKRPALAPGLIMEWLSAGGGTVSATVRSIFADPWPEDIMASLMHAILRRLISAPAAATYLLGCANAVAMVCPSRVKHEQLHQLWDTCLRCSSQEVKFAAVRSALSLLSAQVPPIAQPPSAAAAEVKALASKEEQGMVALVRSTVWWLGENANFGANEFAWQPCNAPKEMAEALAVADSSPGQDQLAAAAVSANPLMAMVITHLQRAMFAGPWEVRVAACQAISKVAVRSGEPFRVQCYSLLAAARPGRASHTDGHRGSDPLGVCTAAGPALELLDQLYAGELVVEQLIAQHGPKRKAWPRGVLKSLQDRNSALLGAICERLCFVPKDLFWPLGVRAKELVVGRQDDSDEEEDTTAAAADQEAAEEEGERAGTSRAKRSALHDSDDSDAFVDEERVERSNSYMEAMEGYDYKPGEDLPTEDFEASVSQRGDESEAYTEEDAYAENRASDDDSDIVLHQGIVQFDFFPEESDEVAVAKGEQVDVEYEVGGWLHVITRAGTRGLVPKSYVVIRDDEAASEGGLSLAGRSSYAESQVDAASDYNTFLQRSGNSVRHRHGASQDSDTGSFRRRSSAGGGPASSYYGHSPLPSPHGRQGQGQQAWQEEQEEDGVVDEAAVAAQLARVEEATAELDRVVGQVEELDATARAGGLFNQPQFMALKEMLQRTLATLDNMPQPQGAARAARRAARDKAASAADKLEGVRRTVMGGASPTASTPLGRSSMGPFGSASRQQATYDALGGEAGYAASSTAGSVYGGYGDRSHSRQASWAGAGGQLQGEGSAPSSLLAEEYSGGLQQQATRAQVQYAFTAEAEGELSVAVGDTLYVEGIMDGWYQVVREADGARGLVPASYVADVDPSYQS